MSKCSAWARRRGLGDTRCTGTSPQTPRSEATLPPTTRPRLSRYQPKQHRVGRTQGQGSLPNSIVGNIKGTAGLAQDPTAYAKQHRQTNGSAGSAAAIDASRAAVGGTGAAEGPGRACAGRGRAIAGRSSFRASCRLRRCRHRSPRTPKSAPGAAQPRRPGPGPGPAAPAEQCGVAC